MAQRFLPNGKHSPSKEDGSSHPLSDSSSASGQSGNGDLGMRPQAQPATAEDLVPDKIMIAVVGPTGTGKSTVRNEKHGTHQLTVNIWQFIRTATGVEIDIGDELEPCTSEISMIKLSDHELSDNDIMFIDTPGFDTLEVSEADVLTQLSDWLRTTFKEKVMLSGLLYFHRVSINRKNGFPQYKSSIFKRLVGAGSFENVILVTTAWDEVDEETGDLREEQLKDGYWQPMIDRRSRIERFKGTRESAFTLLKPFIDQADQRLKNARDLERKKIIDRLRSEITRLGQDQQMLSRKINGELKNPEGRTNLQTLKKEYEELKTASNYLVDTMSTIWDRSG